MPTPKVSTFAAQVYKAVKLIPAGQVSTYAWIAASIGHPRATRAVGRALHVNPLAPQVPCHRVIGSDGHLIGFADGISKKARLLKKEGLKVIDGKIDLEKYGFRP